MDLKKGSFGKTNTGQEVFLFTLSNHNNITMKVMTYGGIVTSLLVPDKTGKIDDIVLGFNTLDEYLSGHPCFGALIGRYGNRIAKGKFVLDGKEYKLAVNNGANHLHGGLIGFDKVVWDAVELRDADEIGVELSYLSQDGEEGYPGNLSVVVKYLLNDKNELVINYEARTDKPTVVNLTQHNYYNLCGESAGDILGHELMINADYYTAVDEGLIPTGEIMPVKATPLDFTVSKKVGLDINGIKGGYDHNFILNKNHDEISLAAKVFEPNSGRIMEVFTTEPGIQFYSGNFLDGTLKGKFGKSYQKHAGFCLEAQHFPDSPNHAHFPSTRLNPGEIYRQVTVYKFSA